MERRCSTKADGEGHCQHKPREPREKPKFVYCELEERDRTDVLAIVFESCEKTLNPDKLSSLVKLKMDARHDFGWHVFVGELYARYQSFYSSLNQFLRI